MPKLVKNSDRDHAIDIAKGLGMVLVIFAHTNYQEPLLTIIYSFHMPLFFIISGMLFNEAKYPSFKGFFVKKVKSLLVPFCIYAGITIVVTCALNLRYGINQEYFINTLDIFKKTIIARNAHDFKYNSPLWFVPCLFLVECLYYYINKIKNTPLFVAAVTALFLVGWALDSIHLDEVKKFYFWNFPAALISISFYALGHRVFLPMRTRLLKKGLSKQKIGVIAIVAIALTIPPALINGQVSLGSNEVNIAPLFIVTGILGSGFILAVSQLIHFRFIQYIGRNSFDFMLIHVLVRSAISVAMILTLKTDFGDVSTDYRYTLPVFILVFAITYAIVWLKVTVSRKTTCNLKNT